MDIMDISKRKTNEVYPGEFKIKVVRDIIDNGLTLLDAYEKYFPQAKGRVARNKLHAYSHMKSLKKSDRDKFKKTYVPPTEEERIQLEKDMEEYPIEDKSISFIKKWVDLYKEEGEARLMENRRKRSSAQEAIPKVIIPQRRISKIISNLKYYRKQAGITGRVLSNAIGRSEDYISKMENNNTLPSLEVFLAILKVYKISVASFFGSESYQKYLKDKKFIQQIQNATPEQRQAIKKILKS